MKDISEETKHIGIKKKKSMKNKNYKWLKIKFNWLKKNKKKKIKENFENSEIKNGP